VVVAKLARELLEIMRHALAIEVMILQKLADDGAAWARGMPDQEDKRVLAKLEEGDFIHPLEIDGNWVGCVKRGKDFG
jgi:hypothetical protein